jgi:DNA ligase-1
MKAFTALFVALDATTATQVKVAAIARWLRQVPGVDAAWGVWFLIGGRPRRLVPVALLKSLAAETAGIPSWLFDECYDTVGDLAETVALLIPPPAATATAPLPSLHELVESCLLPLATLDPPARAELLIRLWSQLAPAERLVWNKLITGAFRLGVSRQLVLRALAEVSGRRSETLAHRMMGGWSPGAAAWQRLLAADESDADCGRPYPFCLAHPLDSEVAELGPLAEWQAEWKWDGIRAQLVRRQGAVQLWSRGDELISASFPELLEAARSRLPVDAVLDGEILVWRDNRPAPFAELQRRLGRTRVTAAVLAEFPVILLAYDLLEYAGQDLRGRPLDDRRALLVALGLPELALDGPGGSVCLQLAPVLAADGWSELAVRRRESRDRGVEGLMLKRRASPYGVGRTRGDWWKWKIDPYSLDAVLIYAQRGHGRRANLYTDYTFAVWQGEALVPFAKAYSGLSDAEIREVDSFIRGHTLERFGPVRTVAPELVFEIAFEDMQLSRRHKSGVAVRFPRMVRLRRDKRPADADHLDAIHAMLAAKTRTAG